MSDDLTLVVSELVTNAILHGKTTRGRQVALVIDRDAKRIRVEVRDVGDGMPRQPLGGEPLPVSGRGLEIVASLSDAWGVIERVIGKTVWAELAIKPSDAV
ncbi:ATP-binding protein [Streptomyces sp. NPDC003703]|uniref:ATP-binding protein n=1 Tax=Streptomyces sp. NPDC003283 TaxID=3364681 RepID=UPI003680543E